MEMVGEALDKELVDLEHVVVPATGQYPALTHPVPYRVSTVESFLHRARAA